jgi:hypothetical protein
MKRFLCLLLLAACGKNAIQVTVSGVTDPNKVKQLIETTKGVGSVQMDSFKDGQAKYTVQYSGKGGDLGAALSDTPLKNVKGFDATSLQISMDGSTPVVVVKPEDPPKPETPPERPKDLPKDPLAYKIHKFSGGSIATFDNWGIQQVPSEDKNLIIFDTAPQGKQNDFVLRVAMGTPGLEDMQNLFVKGPEQVQAFLQGFQRSGEQKKTTYGGDEAMSEEYKGKSPDGRDITVRVVYIKKKDVAVAILAIGTDAGHKEFGRSQEIVAQSVTFTESAIEAELTGTWHLSSFYQSGTGSHQFSSSSATSMTIYPNGTFTEHSMTTAGGQSTASAYVEGKQRGRIVKRGNNLTFYYDGGDKKVWNATYELKGGALMLNGKAWFRN